MAKLLVLSGLPASGKSTYAAEIVAQGNWVRLNRDLLRTMLHFEKFSGRNEGVTVDCEKALARTLLTLGHNVIIDDTNLNPKNKEMWSTIAKECGASFEHKHIDTYWKECVYRDRVREKSVGEHVIVGMAMQYEFYEQPEMGFIIVDLDGTLCDITHRLHYVKKPEGEKKDWKSFFGEIEHDTRREDVYAIVDKYYGEGYEIVFVSGRPDNYRVQTDTWLAKNFEIPYTALFMRRSGDKRPDTEVKQQIYDTYFKDKYMVHKVIDDRPSVVRQWLSNGLDVIDVGNGIEF